MSASLLVCKNVSCPLLCEFALLSFGPLALRAEWCKARARARRWSEEVDLLLEEMRRVIAYHEWECARWTSLVDTRFAGGDRADYREGW